MHVISPYYILSSVYILGMSVHVYGCVLGSNRYMDGGYKKYLGLGAQICT